LIHLAAITFVPEAMENPGRVMEINLNGSINLMTALQQRKPEARFVLVGSSESYGVPQSLPVTEAHPMQAANPYAISKAAADLYVAYLHKTAGADVGWQPSIPFAGLLDSLLTYWRSEIEKGS
jgi:nucleoside-diphosphate-sugar epimerase